MRRKKICFPPLGKTVGSESFNTSRCLIRKEVSVASSVRPTRALDGVKILAFEQVLSGPFATCLLADMGAEVIKVERPGVGDVIRSWDSVVKGLSSGYVWLNRNKRSLTLDVKKAKGREILQELAKRSDIFFENYAPGV